MPKFNVITWTAYDISNFSFYANAKDDCSTMQNNEVMVEAEFMYFSSLKDKNLILASNYMMSLRRFFRLIMLFLKCIYLNTGGLPITMAYKLMS